MFRPVLLSSNHLHVQVPRTYPETAGLVWVNSYLCGGSLPFEEELQLLKDSMIDSMMKELRHNETRNMAESEKLLKAVQAIEVGKLGVKLGWVDEQLVDALLEKIAGGNLLETLSRFVLLVEPPLLQDKQKEKQNQIK